MYLRLKLDLFWAHARGVKRLGVLSDSIFTNCPSRADFYVPVNPWHYAVPTLREMSDSMHTEEDIRLTLEDRDPALASILTGIPLQQCPGLVSRTFDGELAHQFREDTYLQHCKERIIALSATDALKTLDRAIDFVHNCLTKPQSRSSGKIWGPQRPHAHQWPYLQLRTLDKERAKQK